MGLASILPHVIASNLKARGDPELMILLYLPVVKMFSFLVIRNHIFVLVGVVAGNDS